MVFVIKYLKTKAINSFKTSVLLSFQSFCQYQYNLTERLQQKVFSLQSGLFNKGFASKSLNNQNK